MRDHFAGLTAVAVATLALCAAPLRAQNFMSGSAETIRNDYFRLNAAPVQMFGRDGAPDRTGGSFRLGYGITDAFDVEAKTAFFDGVSLVGVDGQFRVLGDDDHVLSLRIGGHQSLVTNAPDSTALDLGAEFSAWVDRRVELYAGTAVSFESVHGPGGQDFTRAYAIPGARFGLSQRVDLQVEAGIGLNHDSPHFVTAGVAVHMPTGDAVRAPRH
jgi:hypothetical protein